eukprot:403362803
MQSNNIEFEFEDYPNRNHYSANMNRRKNSLCNSDNQSVDSETFNSQPFLNQNNNNNKQRDQYAKNDFRRSNNSQDRMALRENSATKFNDNMKMRMSMNSSNMLERSTMSLTSLFNMKRMVVKAPDGTYQYIRNASEADSFMDLPKNEKQQNDERISIMDDELQFILENFEFSPEITDDLMEDYFSNRRVFFFVVILQFFASLYVMMRTWTDKSVVLLHMSQFYNVQSFEQLETSFQSLILFDFVLNMLNVIAGLKAYNSHQIKGYKTFSTIQGICILSRVLLANINSWNVITFMLMIFTYTFSRYMIAVIYALCLVPEQQQQQTQQISNNNILSIQQTGTQEIIQNV